MTKQTEKTICSIPVTILIVFIPLIVKMKYITNPMQDYSWYLNVDVITDFFLYYKSIFITFTGILMVVILAWQISRNGRKNLPEGKNLLIFLPLLTYTILVILSAVFSPDSYFCSHGVPDQIETVWNLLAYVMITIYFFYVTVYKNSEEFIIKNIFIGALLVGIICALQYFKVDIYRLMYAGKGVSFTFDEGTVYGPFYNINYVGLYVALFLPLFTMILILNRSWKVRMISAFIMGLLMITLIGARSLTAVIAVCATGIFALLFVVLKRIRNRKLLRMVIPAGILLTTLTFFAFSGRITAYLKSADTEKTNLESIYTYDDHVEINYQGQQINVAMLGDDASIEFRLYDQTGTEIELVDDFLEDGSLSYALADDRFTAIKITPVLFSQEPNRYGFSIFIDDKEWQFTNQIYEDGSYYYYTDSGKFTKLTPEMASEDFSPLTHMSSFASGRGYIWNKTIPLLKNYIILGRGANAFAFTFPNDDYVDLYNNGYSQMFITKPHNLFLQIAIENGVLALICFIIFYLCYFLSSLRLYYKRDFKDRLSMTGFSVLLGTMGYLISGLANDSTVTVSPLFWALLGMGIGINYKLKSLDICICSEPR